MSTRHRNVTNTHRKDVWMKLRDPDALRDEMTRQGISQRRLARGIGLKTHTHICDLLNGRKTTTSTETAHRIERYLHLPTGALFDARVSTITRHNDTRTKTAA